MFPQNPQHPPQRLRRAPQKLIPHGKSPHILRPQIQFVNVADRHVFSVPETAVGVRQRIVVSLLLWG